MGAARNLAPKWADPDLPWDVAEAAKPTDSESAPLMTVVDRFHNHEEMSPEVMAQTIAELQATVERLDGQLAAVSGEAAEAAAAAKGLGVNMVQMGDAMSKRVRILEDFAQAEFERAAERERVLAEAKPAAKGLAGALKAVMAAVGLSQAPAAPPATT